MPLRYPNKQVQVSLANSPQPAWCPVCHQTMSFADLRKNRDTRLKSRSQHWSLPATTTKAAIEPESQATTRTSSSSADTNASRSLLLPVLDVEDMYKEIPPGLEVRVSSVNGRGLYLKESEKLVKAGKNHITAESIQFQDSI